MTKVKDAGTVRADERSAVVEIPREEYERLMAQADGGGINTAPAVEEGPHLHKRDVRDAKRQQLLDAGVSADDEALTDDLRDILKEG